jgi:hypothetical protein
MVTPSDRGYNGARRLGAIAGEYQARLPNVSAPIDHGDALGRTERRGSNEFPNGTTGEDACAEGTAAVTTGRP